jgi:wyosine [tRNA(Phe)-imidazoG37] synthetase (radical SAM superfamily)
VVLALQVDLLYGPVRSRRLGLSLGINLMPADRKLCSFNCIYCHYGWTMVHTLNPRGYCEHLPSLDNVVERIRLAARSALEFDCLTLSGNGEPTLYPEFAELVAQIAHIRDRFRPNARIALLSNSTGLLRDSVRESLHLIDLPVFKLDAGTPETFRAMNRPVPEIDFGQLSDLLASLEGITLQTLLVDGSPNNISEAELQSYCRLVARIKPRQVHTYSIDRPVPNLDLVRVKPRRLQAIARRAEEASGVTFRPFWKE